VLAATVTEAASRWGDTTFLVAPTGWALSYRSLDRISDEVAAGLAARGVGEGDVVALVLPSIPEHVIAYAAIAKLGAITAGINARLTATERATVIDRADPLLVISTPELAPDHPEVIVITPAVDDGHALAVLRVVEGGIPRLEPNPDRPVAIVFTSGTTGAPKGALFCERQLSFICETDTGGSWGGGGHSLSATSLAHLGPTTKLPGNLRRGGTVHLVDRWRAKDALRLTEEYAMGSIAGIPTQLALMLRDPDLDTRDLSSVKAIIIGGGPATPALVREARARIGAPLATRYSCTEAGIGLGTSLSDDPIDAEVSVGRPHGGVELALRDPETGDDVAAGDTGEVCLRSPAVMSRYWRDPEATRGAFWPDGYVRTGDLGHLDHEGRLKLVGRAREMYVRGGYNVFPMEVEEVLSTHPSVEAITVIGIEDDVMGEIGVAVIVLRIGADAPSLTDLREHGAGRLARHKLPEHLVVIDSLPLTAMEKVDRRALKSWVVGGLRQWSDGGRST
jgi:acyl-CoA synthetase (AMP-forming)/AMP-acid ligase II